MTEQHTPEPWTIDNIRGAQDKSNVYIAHGDDALVASVMAYGPFNPDRILRGRANARRIVAAVNATEGLSTDALEQGVISDLLAAADAAAPQLDSLIRYAAQDGFPVDLSRVDALRAAIARAKGQ